MLDLAIAGGIAVFPEGPQLADIGIHGERIAVIAEPGRLPAATRVIAATGRFVLPGLVDPHTHPGNTRPLAADLASETRSAALGGVTTMLGTVKVPRFRSDSPALTTPADAISYLAAFPPIRRAVDSIAHVDVGFSFVVMTAEHATDIPRMVSDCGVLSFKFMVTYPPTTTWGARVGMPIFPDDGVIFAGFRACAAAGALAMVHAENAQVIEAIGAQLVAGRAGLAAWEARFPGYLEASEIRKAAGFAQAAGARCYIAHVTSREGMAAVELARNEGVDLWAETCPQYLALDLERDEARGLLAKFNPPVRRRADVDVLWAALASGRIAAVGSDHVPNPRSLKMGDGTIEGATAASPGVATLLPLLWTFGVQAGRIRPEQLASVASEGPARLFGLFPRKGAIRPGADADLVVCDPATSRRVDPATLESAADYSAYEGIELVGWPTVTVLRGRVVAEGGRVVGPPRGRYLHRPLS